MSKINHEELENIHVYCFDIHKYNKEADILICNIYANYNGETFISLDVEVPINYFFHWKNNQWVLHVQGDNYEILKQYGLKSILEHIENLPNDYFNN